MPRLIVFVPFKEGGGGDLRDNAEEIRNRKGDLTGYSDVVIVYSGDVTSGICTTGDILVVHGHGGDRGSSLGDNLGEEVSMANVLKSLTTMGANECSSVFFIVCFSAMKGHIAAEWKKLYSSQNVYGSEVIVEGALIKTTRSSVYGSMFSGDDKRMVLL